MAQHWYGPARVTRIDRPRFGLRIALSALKCCAMPPSSLTEDEFRLLAFARADADHRKQHLVPTWLQEQLGFTLGRMQDAARGLAARGLAEFFEWRPDDASMVPPQFGDGLIPMDFKLTPEGGTTSGSTGRNSERGHRKSCAVMLEPSYDNRRNLHP
jgi:hypothetical protein